MIAAQREMDSRSLCDRTPARPHKRRGPSNREMLSDDPPRARSSAVNLVVGIHTRLRWRRNLWDGLALEGLLRSGEGRNAMIVAVEIASRACTYTRCTTCFRN